MSLYLFEIPVSLTQMSAKFAKRKLSPTMQINPPVQLDKKDDRSRVTSRLGSEGEKIIRIVGAQSFDIHLGRSRWQLWHSIWSLLGASNGGPSGEAPRRSQMAHQSEFGDLRCLAGRVDRRTGCRLTPNWRPSRQNDGSFDGLTIIREFYQNAALKASQPARQTDSKRPTFIGWQLVAPC